LWFETSEFNYLLTKVFSIFLMGIVIKIMDDYMDQDIDAIENQPNIYTALEQGGLPYALLLFSLACIFDHITAVSLFLSSFAVGMVGNLTAKMPSGLYGYQESMVIVLLGLVIFKIEMLSSLLIMAAIQLWDDLMDYESDKIRKNNLAFLLGKVECLLLAIIFFLLTAYFDYTKAIGSIITMHLILYIIKILLDNQYKITT